LRRRWIPGSSPGNPTLQTSPDFGWVVRSLSVRAPQLRLGFNVAYLTNPHFTDFVVPNSDRVLSTVDVGFSTIVWARTLLNVTAQFGITGHVPNFRVITSLPIRF